MGNEITYDNASSAELISPKEPSDGIQTTQSGDASDIGCHSNSTQLSALSNTKMLTFLKSMKKTTRSALMISHSLCAQHLDHFVLD